MSPWRALSAAMLLTGAAVADAATLDSISGSVLVNRGGGFAPVSTGALVNPGDRVMVSGNGQARIVYNSTCSVAIPSGQTVTVAATVPCQPGSQADGSLWRGGMSLVAGGLVAGAILSDTGSGNPARPVSP